MIDIEIIFFGWAYNPKKNGNDKVWGAAKVGNCTYSFWGRRDAIEDSDGRHIRFQAYDSPTDVLTAARAKEHPSSRSKTPYRAIVLTRDNEGNYTEIDSIYPNFINRFKRKLFLAKMADMVLEAKTTA